MQTIKPAKNQIFARPQESEKTTKSGIILSESAVDRPQMATVINAGAEVKDYEKDDVIVYKQFTTTDLKLNGEEFILIDQEDVLGTVLEVK